jgi:uncharacterized damage-inducible protein DinB
MSSAELLVDGFERVRQATRAAVEGLGAEQLAVRLDPGANSIGWLVWHLLRVQDSHVAEAAGLPEVWSDGWADRFALPLPVSDTGYGYTSDDVAAVRVASADLLTGYLEAVHAQTVAWVRDLGDDDLARVVDTSYDPPVTLAVRLVSVLEDDLQHAGQAAFVRGVLERTSG